MSAKAQRAAHKSRACGSPARRPHCLEARPLQLRIRMTGSRNGVGEGGRRRRRPPSGERGGCGIRGLSEPLESSTSHKDEDEASCTLYTAEGRGQGSDFRVGGVGLGVHLLHKSVSCMECGDWSADTVRSFCRVTLETNINHNYVVIHYSAFLDSTLRGLRRQGCDAVRRSRTWCSVELLSRGEVPSVEVSCMHADNHSALPSHITSPSLVRRRGGRG